MKSRLFVSAFCLRHSACRLLFASFVAGLLLPLSNCALVSASEDTVADARAWLEQLRDSDYEKRRQAADKLAALGEAARDVLEQATRSDDTETRAEAAVLLKKLETASLSLFVFDRDGQPAAGAEAELGTQMLRASNGWEQQAAKSITVSADGTASLACLLPGEGGLHFTWQQRFMTQECSPCWPFHISRGDNPVFITLAKGGAVEVPVLDPAGAPLKDARVQLFRNTHFLPELLDLQATLSENWGQAPSSGVAGADGVAKVEATEGTYQCVAQAYGFLPGLAGTVHLAEGQTTRLPAVKLEKKNAGQLHLTLLKADGAPLKKTRISIQLDYQFAGPEAARLQREARQLRVQLNMRGRADQSETDEQGKVAIDDLHPGKYALMLTSSYSEEAPWQAPEVAIEAGQTKELEPLKPCAVGSIEGRIRGPDSKGQRYNSVSAVEEADLADGYPDTESYSNWGFRMQRRFGGSRSSQSRENGLYVLKNLLPGRYAVCINTGAGQQVWVFGLEVAAGQSTKAPDAVIPAAVAPLAQEMKGTVFLPNGKPAEKARVAIYEGTGGSSSTTCDEKGSFHLSDRGLSGGHLIVKAAGCRPLCLDVSVPGLRLDDLALSLQKQEYGSLRARVLDESGKPLEGVTLIFCGPPRSRFYSRGYSQERRFATNRSGEVRLSGLAVGERGLRFQYDGYSPPEDFKIVIAPDTETQATVVLRKGLVLSGRVEAPEGNAYARTVVSLLGQTNRTSRVTPEGRFTFAGLAAGTYSVMALAPGLISADPAKAVLSLDGALPEPCLKLVRPCGAAIAVGGGFEGWSAVPVPKGSWDPLPPLGHPAAVASWEGRVIWWPHPDARADAAGRAEFRGLAPGEYDVLLTQVSDRVGYPYSFQQRRGTPEASVQLVAGPIAARTLSNAAELRALPAVVLKVETGSASVSGRLVCPKAVAEMGDNLANVTISLVGRAAVGRLDFAYPSALTHAVRRKPMIIGTPPPGMPLGSSEPGTFLFSKVPPGKYKVVAEVNRYPPPYGRTAEQSSRQPPVLLAAIVVPADAHLDLGKLEYDLPWLASKPEDATNDWREIEWRSAAEPEDQIPLFQP